MKRLLTLLTVLATAVIISTAADNATALLNSVASRVRSAKSLDISFKASGSSGKLLLAGDRFRMTSSEMTVWYDGHTQWAYSPSTGECNITTPTSEELAQINPFAIVKALRNNFTAKIVASGKGTSTLLLTAKNKHSDFRTVRMTVNTATNLPTAIDLTDRVGHVTKISVTSARIGDTQPSSVFTFDKRKYPRAEIIDLR